MTIAIVSSEMIVADSRLCGGIGERPLTVGKIFHRKGGGIFTTTGDSRRTAHFEKAMSAGKEPEPLEVQEDESFDGVLLKPDGKIVYFDLNFAAFPVSEKWIAVGGPELVASSWMMNNATPIQAVARCIEVHNGCGYPIQVVPLKGKPYQIAGPWEVPK